MNNYCHLPFFFIRSGSDWLKVTPVGIRRMLNWVKFTYGDFPIYITENGVSDRNGSLQDEHRIFYYKHYINNVFKGQLNFRILKISLCSDLNRYKDFCELWYNVITSLANFVNIAKWNEAYNMKFKASRKYLARGKKPCLTSFNNKQLLNHKFSTVNIQ